MLRVEVLASPYALIRMGRSSGKHAHRSATAASAVDQSANVAPPDPMSDVSVITAEMAGQDREKCCGALPDLKFDMLLKAEARAMLTATPLYNISMMLC